MLLGDPGDLLGVALTERREEDPGLDWVRAAWPGGRAPSFTARITWRMGSLDLAVMRAELALVLDHLEHGFAPDDLLASLRPARPSRRWSVRDQVRNAERGDSWRCRRRSSR